MTNVSSTDRKQVRQRANGRCEYCRKPDIMTAYGHQIDHVISIKQGGLSTLDNYAYACLYCNGHKGSDIAAYDDETKQLITLYNPRKQR